jgi:hypothetical protein
MQVNEDGSKTMSSGNKIAILIKFDKNAGIRVFVK